MQPQPTLSGHPARRLSKRTPSTALFPFRRRTVLQAPLFGEPLHTMRVDLFDFDLPPDRIARRPPQPRDAARLLSVTPAALGDHVVGDLPGLLKAGDLLVFND